MPSTDLIAEAARVIALDGYYLDRRRWDDWLGLYAPDVEYWAPTWKSESEPTSSPGKELSLIYYKSRVGLEDRVWRAASDTSPASTPLPRTSHSTSNLVLVDDDASAPEIHAAWVCHAYSPKIMRHDTLFGSFEYKFRREEGAMIIARKKVIIMNDLLPSVVDFYHL